MKPAAISPRRHWGRAAWLVVLSCLACGGPDSDGPRPSLLDDPLAAWPEKLSDVGLYPDPARLDVVDERAVAFRPLYELWSDGGSKARYVVVPDGEAIALGDTWDFPVGTLFFKTFSYATPSSPSEERPIETRALRHAADGWDYAAYIWKGDDAARADLRSSTATAVRDDDVNFTHLVPSRNDCRACHEANPVPVIGFDELRLNTPLAPATVTQLEALHERGVLVGTLPTTPEAVDHADTPTRWVLGYLHGNCAHCHGGSTSLPEVLDLRHDQALASTIGVDTAGSGSAAGVRIVAGDSTSSILFLAFSGETENPEVRAMPPLGVARRDAFAIEELRAWIDGL